MAGSLADMLVQSSLQGAQASGEQLASGIKTGAALAQQIEQTQQIRQQMEQQKEQLQLQKVDKLTGLMEKGAAIKSKAARNAFFKNYIPKTAAALGLQNFIPEDTMMMIQADPEQAKKLTLLKAKIRSGEMTMSDAVSQLDPEAFASMDEAEVMQLEAADKFRIDNQEKMGRAQFVASEAGARADEARTQAGQVELAKKVADKYATYTAGGGRAGMQSSLKSLKDVANALENGVVTTGGATTKLPWLKSDDAQSMLNPKMVEFKTQAQAALNNVLRATLGAQFTEGEGVRVLNQVWDDRQAPAVNAKKVRSKLKELEQNVKDAESEFRRFKYLGEEKVGKTYKIGGQDVDAATAKAFYKANPQFLEGKPDLKKELGL